jgi:angio-associated migratory cell protein
MDPIESNDMKDADQQMDGAASASDDVHPPYDVEDGDFDDDTPVFINPGDAVEVVVDDDDVPMDEDDDEDDAGASPGDGKDDQAAATAVVDMSRVLVASHTGPVYAVSAHPVSDQQLCVLSGGGDDKAFLHSVGSANQEVKSVALSHPYSDTVSSVALNLAFVDDKTPKYAATGCFDGSIVIYNAESGQLLQTLEGPSDVEFLTFHPKGGSVLLAGSATDATLWMFHVPLNRCLQVFVGHEASISCGAFSPDGRWVLSGSADGTLRVWAPRTGASKHVFRFQSSSNSSATQAAGITCMSMGGEDQQLVMVGAEDGQAHVCHIGTKKVVASLRHYQVPPNFRAAQDDDEDDMEAELPMSVEAVGFSPSNPHWCATGGVDGVLRIWDLTTGQCRQVCQPPPLSGDAASSAPTQISSLGGITRLHWHPTLPAVVTCTTLGSVHVWDARNGQLLHTATGHTDVINDISIIFNPQTGSATLVTAGEDHGIRIFELEARVFSGAL